MHMYSLLLYTFWFSSKHIGRHECGPYLKDREPCSVLSILSFGSSGLVIVPIVSPASLTKLRVDVPPVTSPRASHWCAASGIFARM